MAILPRNFKLPNTERARSIASGVDLGAIPVTQERKLPSTGLAGAQRSVTETVPLRETAGFVTPRTAPATQTIKEPTTPLQTATPAPLASQTITLPSGKEVTVDQMGNITSGVPTFAVDTAQITPNISAPVVQTAVTDRPTQSDILSPIMAQQEEIQRLQQEAIRLAQPTELETQTLQDIRDFDIETQRQFAISEARRAPTFAIRGEQAEIQQQSAIQRNALTNQLQALTDLRAQRGAGIETALGFTQNTFDNLLKVGSLIAESLETNEDQFVASRQGAVANVVAQGITDPLQIFQLINFDEQGNQVGDITLDEIKKVTDFVNAGGELTDAQIGNGFKLASAYESASKDFFTQRDAYNRILASASDPSAAGDLALIFNYMKLLDPGSVVREGEFANAQNAAGVPERIKAQYNRLINGERLTADTRADFVSTSDRLFDSALEQQSRTDSEFINRAQRLGIPKDLVVRETGSTGRAGADIDAVVGDILKQFPNASEDEIIRIVEEELSFNNVGGDTKQASNLPQRNNNPGNVKSGGLADAYAIGTDPQGHLIFPDADTGFLALEQDLRAKVSGNSRFLPANPTIAELGKVYAEDPNWAKSVSQILGVSPTTKTQDINFVSLLQAIARQEGFYAT